MHKGGAVAMVRSGHPVPRGGRGRRSRRGGQRLRGLLPGLFLVAGALVSLPACEESARVQDRPPVPLTPADECHVCGMLITRFPGPKGEAWVTGAREPYKFCSTRDLFAWLLQPETAAVVQQIYVHDMGATDWAHPEDSAFVDARRAWYVAGSDARGAMGPTLASFARRDQAEAFARSHGGRVLGFAAIDLDVLEELAVPPPVLPGPEPAPGPR